VNQDLLRKNSAFFLDSIGFLRLPFFRQYIRGVFFMLFTASATTFDAFAFTGFYFAYFTEACGRKLC